MASLSSSVLFKSSRLKQLMVEIAAAQGVTVTTEEVRGFLLAMDDEEEFDDIELDPIALTAIAGGQNGGRGC